MSKPITVRPDPWKIKVPQRIPGGLGGGHVALTDIGKSYVRLSVRSDIVDASGLDDSYVYLPRVQAVRLVQELIKHIMYIAENEDE